MILVGSNTGLRLLSEALALRRADVDLVRGILTVPAAYAKSGKTRSVPLNSVLRRGRAAHRNVARAGVEHVFANSGSGAGAPSDEPQTGEITRNLDGVGRAGGSMPHFADHSR